MSIAHAVSADALRQKLVQTNAAILDSFETLLEQVQISLDNPDQPVPVADVLRVMRDELQALIEQMETLQGRL